MCERGARLSTAVQGLVFVGLIRFSDSASDAGGEVYFRIQFHYLSQQSISL